VSGDKLNFFSFSLPELTSLLAKERGEPEFRAVQLFEWVYRKSVTDVGAMSNIARSLRDFIDERFVFLDATVEQRVDSSDGTRKYLIKLPNGQKVETVLIKQPNRYTLCVSSQVGCGMACSFCRTGTMGFIRHLDTSEILAQVRLVMSDAAQYGASFSNMVFMGMGEPLHNFDNVARATKILTSEYGFRISPRKITISTVGLVPAIVKFRTEVPASLAVSLNATTDEVRSAIMPVNRKYPLNSLLETLRTGWPSYLGAKKNKNQVTVEYVMLSGVNDTPQDLQRLPKLLKGIAAKINLIPYNSNAGLGFSPPTEEWAHCWLRKLSESGIRTTIRWSKGPDIDAACGQLATKEIRQKRPTNLPFLEAQV
jgi:23S rRNA (adenine2503-C2)-methyltransferase